MSKLYVLGALVSRYSVKKDSTEVTTTIVSGYRVAECSDEAIGNFAMSVLVKDKPGFLIDDITCMEVSSEILEQIEQ